VLAIRGGAHPAAAVNPHNGGGPPAPYDREDFAREYCDDPNAGFAGAYRQPSDLAAVEYTTPAPGRPSLRLLRIDGSPHSAMTSRSPQNRSQALRGQLDAYLKLSPDAVLALDTDGRIRAANRLAGELFRYDPADLTRLTIEQLVPERFRVAHIVQREAYRQAPRARRMGAALGLRGRRKDGSEFPIDVSLQPLPDEGGHLVVAAIRDMTQRQREQAAAAQLAAIINSSADAIFSMTAEGMITSWNPGAGKLLGYTAQEVTGRRPDLFLPEERGREFATAMKRALGGDHVERFETRCVRRDGSGRRSRPRSRPCAVTPGGPAGSP
jgi:PAS domain S-box-containing protein